MQAIVGPTKAPEAIDIWTSGSELSFGFFHCYLTVRKLTGELPLVSQNYNRNN